MISISEIIQIAILYLVIYAILKGARGSRFGQALLGLGIISSILIASSLVFHFDVLSRILQFLILYIAVSSVVIFQPEIRRILVSIGALTFLNAPHRHPDGSPTPELVIDTIFQLASAHMGALIAFERGISLRSYEASGVPTDAIFSPHLVRTIFTPPLPLHDGGVIIRDGRLAAAHCIFPVSNNPELIISGLRHRAAVGLSEETDALVLVVSEETGCISIARNGRLYRYSLEEARQPVSRWITKALQRETKTNDLTRLTAPLMRLLSRTEKGPSK